MRTFEPRGSIEFRNTFQIARSGKLGFKPYFLNGHRLNFDPTPHFVQTILNIFHIILIKLEGHFYIDTNVKMYTSFNLVL